MSNTPLFPLDEIGRMAAVRRYDILNTPPDGPFDRITALAARHFDVPTYIISIVVEDRNWFKSRRGVPVGEIGRFSDTSREQVPLGPSNLAAAPSIWAAR